MSFRIIWRPAAQADLIELYNWIARQAGTEIAFGYTSAIEAYAAKLAELPQWGAEHDDHAPGIRTITYRRRTTIAYHVVDHSVEIVALAHGGRDLGRAFGHEND